MVRFGPFYFGCGDMVPPLLNHKLDHMQRRIDQMSVTLDRATASLERLNNAATAIEQVLDMVVAEVRASGTDDPKVLAALDAIDAKSDEIVAKALANTPAASQVPTTPVGPQATP